MNLFDYSNIGQISDLVRDQFPDFYKEDGPNFIQFIQAYYEWLEHPDNPVGQARNRYKQFDIDTASAAFLDHYRSKYMWGLPPELLGNQRLLQKHILELYRSKGSQQAIRLLFRLLFNEDIEFYIPSYDIFKLSDNTWTEPKYIEVTAVDNIGQYIGQHITGSNSGSSAIVESFQSRIVNGGSANLLFVSNIKGTFEPGETLIVDGISAEMSPIVVGSVSGVNILTSSPGIAIGDTLTANIGEVPVKIVVTETFEGSGTLEFNVVKPGSYYSLDAVFHEKKASHVDKLYPIVELPISEEAYGFDKLPTANSSSKIVDSIYIPGIDNIVSDSIPISGSNGMIKVKTIRNPFIYQYNSDMLLGFVDVPLNGDYPFTLNPESNTETIITDSIEFTNITVGEIESVTILNPGNNYSANTWFIPIDPYTSASGILDANGEFVGQNGMIIGTPQLGTSIAKSAKVVSSGYNNINYNTLTFTHNENDELGITAQPIIGGIGTSEGFYENTKSFLSDDKYLFDGHYYQDFSYVIKASTTLDRYIDILKQLAHPAGNAVYGDINITRYNPLEHDVVAIRFRSRNK